MKKSYFWGLLLAILALIPSQNAFADYCTFSGNSKHTERRLQSFTLTDGVTDAAVQNVQPALRSAVYKDMTSVVFETSPGATISFKALDWKGSWMHGYAYIDYDNDQVFNQENELVSYSFYSPTDANTGTNSKGESVGNGGGISTTSMPSWVIPTDLAAGDYRFRFKGDWNSKDPCGITGSTNNTANNGGFMVDITIRVVAAIPERTISVEAVPAEGGSVSGAGTAAGNITITATPNPGYEFVNWTLNGEVVGTDVVFTDAAEGDKTYVANFAALTAYPEMSYIYTNGMDQANRYLKEVVATAGETVTTVFSAATTSELPKIDPNVTGIATTVGAYVDKTATPIIVPQGTTEFTVNFKAWTESMTVGSSSASCQLNWTQQAVFVDWNNNFYFYDEGENYGKSGDGMPNADFITTEGYDRTFSVPEGIQPGVYRMRVCYFEPNGDNAQQWQNTLFEKGNCTTRNGKTYDFAIEVIEVTPETPVYAVSVATADETMGTAEVSATEAEEGTEVTFTATAAEGYQFVNWTSGEEVVSTENPYTVAVTAEMALTANFELIPVTKYAVSVATADEAMGTAEVSATEAEEGTEVTFTATAAEGYQFVNWTSGEEVVSTENPYTVAVTAEMALTANFELIPVTKYTVTVNAGVGGTAEASATEVEEGQTVTLTATAAEGYTFANWTSSAVEPVYYIQNYTSKKYLGYNTVNLAAIDEQTSDATIAPSTLNDGEFTIYLTNATYDQQTPPQQQSYLNCGSSGRFSGNCDNTFAAQQIAIFKVENPAAETITATKVTEVKAGETYLFVGLKNDAYYALTDEIYKENDATGQRMVGAEVTITDGTITYVPGTSSALWTLGNKAVASTENPYTVTVTADVEYTANFVEVPVVKYPVSVTTVDGAMGTAEVSATEVEEGDEVTFTATANLGYKFIGWLANGETVSTENPYTTAVTAEMSLVANFEALTPAIIVTNDTTGVERQFTFDAFVEGAKVQIDWGNGELEEYDIAYYDSWTTWTTTITGTLKGEGIVKIYGDQIRSFDCSYAASYPVKVTSLDLTGCPNLYELVCNSNQLTALDLSANTALVKLTANNSAFAEGIDLSANTALTTIDFNAAGLTTIDLSANTALTSVKLNDNQLDGLDLSANTALTTLYANNTGLTSIDLSANTSLNALYLNNNQLTTLDVSKMSKGSATRIYIYAKNNNLTEFVTSEQVLLSSTRIYIDGNAFTLATLPAISGINAYVYAPQQAMTIATEITEGEELDLSSQAMVGENATVYAWYTTEGEEFTGYTVEGGKFVFDVDADTELYCTMTNASFDKFSGANVFKTTNIVVKNFAPAIIVKHAEANIERQFTFDATEEGATIFIDWGDGNLQEYAIAYYDNWDAWETTINGTILGDGTVKIYGDQIHMFDCSYSSSYPVKVTEVNVANCPSLYEFSCYTNEITSLDLTSNATLVKVYANGNPALNNIEFAAENAMTTLDLNDCAFTTLDLSSCTSLTSLSVNNNTGLGSLDVTALTALKTLNANNIGLTSIDLSANVKLATLRLNDNQLTSLNISACATNIYLWADNNNLTDLIVSEGLKASAKVSVKNNNFTLATLPALKVLTTDGTKYVYAPQKPLAIAAEINEGEELDLSAQNNIVGRATEAQATVYTWYTADGTEFTNYTVEGGKFVFNVTEDTELYCAMTTEAFPSFSGTNAFTTTNIVVKYVPVERKVQFKSSDIVMGTVQIISPSQGGTGTGGTGTGGTGTGGTGTSGTGTSGTGTSGTGTGSATSGGGQSPWVITTEDVTAQASVQGNAYEFVNWTIGEEIVGTELTYTYTGEEEALIQANFRQKDTYKTITIDVKPVVKDEFGTNLVGSVKFQGRSGKTAIIEQGSSLTAVATAKDGYEFSSWKDASTGEDVSFDAEYTFTVAADINLEAWFSELPVITTCQVLVEVAPTEDYGTVVIEGVEGLLAEVEVGTEVTAVATPAEGKIFEGWFTFEGDELSTNATYTFTATEDVVVVAWFTDAPEAEYCTYEGKSTHSERRLNAVTITDGTNSTAVSSIQPYFRGDVYVDKTDVVFPSYAGATVNFSEFDFKGEWMHAYVYIDYNNDKVFDTTVNADGTTGGELVSFTFYSPTDSGTGVNSLGETVSNYTIPMVDYLPAFTLPKDLEDGEYRVRIKTDWCHLDPCGHPTETANKLTANGGCIADFTMSVSDFNGIESADADAVQVYAADGVIYINGYEGDVKVVNAAGQVIKDVNVNGNDTLEVAAGLYIVVTGDQVTKVVVK